MTGMPRRGLSAIALILLGALLLTGSFAPSVLSATLHDGNRIPVPGAARHGAPIEAALPAAGGGPSPNESVPGRILANLTYSPPGPQYPYWPIGGVFDPGTGRIYSPQNGIGQSGYFDYLLSATPGSFALNSSNISVAGVTDSIALDGANGIIYLGEINGSNGYAQIQPFDPATGTLGAPVASPLVGFPGSMVYDPSDGLVFLTAVRFVNSLTPVGGLGLFDPATGSFVTNGPAMPAGFIPELLALAANDSTLYIGGLDINGYPSVPLEVLAVNLSTFATFPIPLPAYPGTNQRPGSIAFDPADDGVYFASSAVPSSGPITENVTVIDARTNTIVTSIALPSVHGESTWSAGALTYDPENSYLYLSQNPSPYYQSVFASNNSTVVALNGILLTSGNPFAFLNSSLLPTGGIYVPASLPGHGGELWFPSFGNSRNLTRGGYAVLALPPEITAFSADPTLLDQGMSTTIRATTALGAGNFSYRYGGLPAGCLPQNASNLTCVPTANGTFPISLEVTDGLGERTNASVVIEVNPPLALSGAVSSLTPDVGETVHFSATPRGGEAPYLVTWYFGDGAEQPAAIAVHAYGAAGSYAAYALVNDSLGQVREIAFSVLVFQGPTGAAIVANRTVTDVGLPLRLDALVGNGSPPLAESWGFGDGSANGSGPTVVHAFRSPGSFVVNLSVTDSNGLTSRSALLIAVNPDPIGRIAVGPSALVVNETATFSERVEGGTGPFSYAWTFGDGTTDTSASPTHLFARAGNFTVSVEVTDAAGATVTNSTVVQVTAAEGVTHPPASGSGGLTAEAYELALVAAVLGAVAGFGIGWIGTRRRTPPPPTTD